MQSCIDEESYKNSILKINLIYMKLKKKPQMNNTCLNISKIYLKTYTQIMHYFLKNWKNEYIYKETS